MKPRRSIIIKEKYLDDKTLEEKNNNIFLEMTQKCSTPIAVL
jgi:hypothetical protein